MENVKIYLSLFYCCFLFQQCFFLANLRVCDGILFNCLPVQPSWRTLTGSLTVSHPNECKKHWRTWLPSSLYQYTCVCVCMCVCLNIPVQMNKLNGALWFERTVWIASLKKIYRSKPALWIALRCLSETNAVPIMLILCNCYYRNISHHLEIF